MQGFLQINLYPVRSVYVIAKRRGSLGTMRGRSLIYVRLENFSADVPELIKVGPYLTGRGLGPNFE